MSGIVGVPRLAEKIERLISTVPREDRPGELHTSNSLADAVTERGVPVTRGYIGQLRRGERTNPSFRLLEAISDEFGVPITYFSDESVETSVNDTLDQAAALRKAALKTIDGILARGSDRKSWPELLAMLEQAEKDHKTNQDER